MIGFYRLSTPGYKRFNVGEYMRQKRLGWLAVEEKNKKAKRTSMKLNKRLDKKVK
jgi:hypothetical protein